MIPRKDKDIVKRTPAFSLCDESKPTLSYCFFVCLYDYLFNYRSLAYAFSSDAFTKVIFPK